MIASKSPLTLKIPAKEAFYAQANGPRQKTYELTARVMVENVILIPHCEGGICALFRRALGRPLIGPGAEAKMQRFRRRSRASRSTAVGDRSHSRLTIRRHHPECVPRETRRDQLSPPDRPRPTRPSRSRRRSPDRPRRRPPLSAPLVGAALEAT